MFSVVNRRTGKIVDIIFKYNTVNQNICSCAVNRNKKFFNKYADKFKTSHWRTEDSIKNVDSVKDISGKWDDDFEILDTIKPNNKVVSEEILGNSVSKSCGIDISIDTDTDDVLTCLDVEERYFDDKITNILQRRNKTPTSVLEPDSQDVSHVSPIIRPAYNFAAYIDTSEILQKLLSLGVDFYKLEGAKTFPSFLLQLDYEKDIEPYIRFLLDKGIRKDKLGRFITLNVNIFKENFDDLEVRINYLESKNFKPEVITKIINVNPKWLSVSVADIDCALGYFKHQFNLSADEVRLVAAKNPKLITRNRDHLDRTTFTIKEEMGFDDDEIKQLMVTVPKIWHIKNDRLFGRFNVVHNEMMIPHKQIVQDPACLLSRQFRIRDRHKFLKTLNKAQYDPTKPRYISLKMLVSGNDEFFCKDVAKVSIAVYNEFLKTL